ncbi:hypothetical protein BCR43DRAFT_496066 [Syncephalastrum racemosum]|uniref:Octanoyltransferase n=1 Tax=Syncephalastrum racemosum TaxID=13706 RepID=A0A1X2H870_SYNRA|nr:hypothetical protein BCR43DRAFT_496066 [Syncephalastrum racemosum]
MNFLRPLSRHARQYTTCTQSTGGPPIQYISLVDRLVKYDDGLRLQQDLIDQRRRGGPNTIVFLQHTPTFTAGRRIRGEDDEAARLRALGADYYETMRGGQVTFHGPGQLVAYPILDIRDYQLNVRCYVSRLEKTVIECCRRFGIEANTTENTGVWVGQDHKIAALGVHLQRYISSHGLALNCNVDLKWYDHIVPCGLADKEVTSLSLEKKRTVEVKEALPELIASFETLFGTQLVEQQQQS